MHRSEVQDLGDKSNASEDEREAQHTENVNGDSDGGHDSSRNTSSRNTTAIIALISRILYLRPVASGSKASRVYGHIRVKSPHKMHLKDVHKMIARIKKSRSC